MGGEPASMACRRAVRAELADLAPGTLVLAACSGGADSLALAAALAWVAPRAGLRAGAVCVDHRLQEDSAAVAGRASAARSSSAPRMIRTCLLPMIDLGGVLDDLE